MLTKNQLARQMQSLDAGDDASRRQILDSLLSQKSEDWRSLPEETITPTRSSLIALLNGDGLHATVRQQIVVLMGNFGEHASPAVPTLVGLLHKGVPESMREAAVRSLAKIGKAAASAVGDMVEVLPDAKPKLAIEILRAIRTIGSADKHARAALLAYWNTPNTVASQAETAYTLRHLKVECENAGAFLVRLLNEPKDIALRKLAAEALGLFDAEEPGVAPALLMAAITPQKDDSLATLANASLERLGLSRADAFEECAKQLNMTPVAETALRTPQPLAVEAAIHALSSRDKRVREKAANILAHHGATAIEAAPSLRKLLKSDDRHLKLAAAKALCHISKDPLAVDALVELLTDSAKVHEDSEDKRRQFLQTVIEALWRAGAQAKGAVTALTKVAKDPNRHVRESAERALTSIKQATI